MRLVVTYPVDSDFSVVRFHSHCSLSVYPTVLMSFSGTPAVFNALMTSVVFCAFSDWLWLALLFVVSTASTRIAWSGETFLMTFPVTEMSRLEFSASSAASRMPSLGKFAAFPVEVVLMPLAYAPGITATAPLKFVVSGALVLGSHIVTPATNTNAMAMTPRGTSQELLVLLVVSIC